MNYYYVAGYIDNYDDYIVSPAQNTKVDYILSCFKQMGKYLHVFSTALGKKPGLTWFRKIKTDNYDVSFISSFSYKTKIGRKLLKLYIRLQLLVFFSKRNKDDVVIIYHDIYLLYFLNKYKKKRKFKIIYEVEEIYSHAWNQTSKKIEYEVSSLRYADGYVFVTESLNKYINKDNKPYVVASGSYTSIPKINKKFDDGLFHCVYAGTFDTTKAGVTFAIAAAKYLNKDYKMHILGFGTNKQIEHVKQLIKQNNNDSKCIISYDGCLNGDDYNSLLQSCHIGLSTQDPNALFNKSSFSSKIMVYLANGLNVVSIYTDEIASFRGADAIDFYYNNQPQDIANAIIKSSKKLIDGRKIIDDLNASFIEDFKKLLSKFEINDY